MSARLARAILARLDGVFDDPDLLSFGALCDTDTDIRRFCADVIAAEPETPEPPRIGLLHRTGEPWVGDWIGADEVIVTARSFEAAKDKNAGHGCRWFVYSAVAEMQDGRPGYRLLNKD